ncbi:MAG: type II toxin-antitoxin system RelE/ParE family toxin [Thermoleophilia bacterium]|nr:type II toxin-antitoxin system RelE/ParE family toxin [Thermoleophilia bacterium]
MEIEFLDPRAFQKWRQRLGRPERSDILRRLELLQAHGVALGMPNVRRLDAGLWELRSGKHRLYFTVDVDAAVFLAFGDKDSQQRDIRLAKERMR